MYTNPKYSDPKLSVIIPIYKVEKFLNRCVDSVINQSYNNLEIILVDDGSPDNCPQICDDYAKRDKRIRILHKLNGGLSDARNAGIDLATGDYIVFVDSDDYVDEKMFEKLMNAITETNADIGICNFEYVDEQGNSIPELNNYYPVKSRTYTAHEVFFDCMAELRYCDWVVAWNKIYKKEIFDNLRYPLHMFNEDEYVANELYMNDYKIVGVSDIMYYYVQRSGSIMNTASKIKLADGGDALLERSDRWSTYNTHNSYTMLCYAMDRISYLYEDKDRIASFHERYRNYKKKIRCVERKLWGKKLNKSQRLKILGTYISPYWFWKIYSKDKVN